MSILSVTPLRIGIPSCRDKPGSSYEHESLFEVLSLRKSDIWYERVKGHRGRHDRDSADFPKDDTLLWDNKHELYVLYVLSCYFKSGRGGIDARD